MASEPLPQGELVRWADRAQYTAEPMPEKVSRTRPSVTLLNATPDPLGSLAALCGIYSGRVVRSLAEVTDDERREAFTDMMATALNGPLEVAQFHFLIEGVDRAFTHQAVRGRSAFYAQESLRFAVPEEDWETRTTLPPSIAGTHPDATLWRDEWDDAIADLQAAYQTLVNSGMPAEEARGLVPHALQTRYHWVTDLRELIHVAGLRTCTQAQFVWRVVMGEIARALRGYASGPSGTGADAGGYCDAQHREDAWQFEFIADQLRPVCYQTGRCGFMAKFDRGCKIRERVEANAKIGRPPSEWGEEAVLDDGSHVCSATVPSPWAKQVGPKVHSIIPAINPAEWATDPGAART